MADIADHPLSHQELRQLRQAPGRERQVMLGRAGFGDLLDLPPLRQAEPRRAAALVSRVQRGEPVGVEVTDHIADPVLAGERNPGDRQHDHVVAFIDLEPNTSLRWACSTWPSLPRRLPPLTNHLAK
jgi:hypothetical protein